MMETVIGLRVVVEDCWVFGINLLFILLHNELTARSADGNSQEFEKLLNKEEWKSLFPQISDILRDGYPFCRILGICGLKTFTISSLNSR